MQNIHPSQSVGVQLTVLLYWFLSDAHIWKTYLALYKTELDVIMANANVASWGSY